MLPRDRLASRLTALGSFTANNSVQPGGIHPLPGQTTGGNGAVTGSEVTFSVNFTTPFNLPAGHYFFVPQVEVRRRGIFLALGSEADCATGNAFPRRLHRSSELDTRSNVGP